MANDWGHIHRKIKGKKQEYKNSDMIFFPLVNICDFGQRRLILPCVIYMHFLQVWFQKHFINAKGKKTTTYRSYTTC